jgi:diaminopimelate decarboxylase
MTGRLPLHVKVDNFEVRDNCLCLGGKTVPEIASELGRTPFYAYDLRLIQARIKHLKDTLPQKIRLHYAVKANPMPAVVQLIGRHVDGLDVASAGELAIAIDSGVDNKNISFAGPGKTPHELEAAISAGITINIESETELNRIVSIADSTGVRPKIAVRINPDFELKNSGMKMSGGPKQFGIDAESVPKLLPSLKRKPVEFEGFHIFSGSQNLRPDAICESQTKSVALAIELATPAPFAPRSINIGGGFGVPYFPGDEPLDLTEIGHNLDRLLHQLEMELPGTELVLELGRYIIAEAGIYICKILDRKVSRGEVFLVTDGGLHQHLAASGNFGQVIRKNYPVLIANKIHSRETETASVVGPLCTPLDVLANKMNLVKADVGDYVAVFQSGAYGLTASPTAFLSHPPPAELLL